MIIRQAKGSDLEGIIKVLKASLGEQSSKKNSTIWNYKHVLNPFGPSLVLVAEDQEKIVGVRAFMRWEWRFEGKSLKAYRAVDTATHPEFQGKGIFKKLTLEALSYAREEGGDFVFNTPNSQSKPGYLKMGWEEIGNLNVKLIPLSPFFWKSKLKHSNYTHNIRWTQKGMDKLLNSYNINQNSRKLYTPKSKEFLVWRYVSCPLQEYLIDTSDDYFIAGYVKVHSKFRELRISELIVRKGMEKEVKSIVRSWAKTCGTHFISFSNTSSLRFLININGGFGPSFTVRNIQEKNKLAFDFSDCKHIDNWVYSLGDLELF